MLRNLTYDNTHLGFDKVARLPLIRNGIVKDDRTLSFYEHPQNPEKVICVGLTADCMIFINTLDRAAFHEQYES